MHRSRRARVNAGSPAARRRRRHRAGRFAAALGAVQHRHRGRDRIGADPDAGIGALHGCVGFGGAAGVLMSRAGWTRLAVLGAVTMVAALCAFGPAATDVLPALAAGAARNWKICGLAIGLGVGALAYAPVAPGAAVFALALSQVVSQFC